MLRPTASLMMRATRPASDLARIQLIGRLAQDPEVRQTRAGKEYVRYTVATSDPLGPPAENGERPPPTTSFHNIFAFGDNNVQRISNMAKGTQVFVEADFRLAKGSAEEGGPQGTNILVQHRNILTVNRPRNPAAQGEA